MDSLATTLLSTNLPPTDLQSDSVRQLILNYQQGALDLRVQYRGRTLPLDVIARRERALRSIAAWKVVLSPVRRLPCEVLSEIFVFCVVPALRSRSTSADDPREPPILMSHVCALWRNVALNREFAHKPYEPYGGFFCVRTIWLMARMALHFPREFGS
ncbi:hypothetical protein B0H14DRAFT_2514755 [Mycena olivaceomarginata]|nr:hypothetical protein B0H14DRAFT_2514755 [Mycena olivaceomarginata]